MLSLRSPLVGLPVTDAHHRQGAPRRRPHGVRPVQEDHRGRRCRRLHHDSLSRALSKPHVAEHMRQKVVKRLNLAAARAGDTKIELLDCADNMVRDRASTFVLGLGPDETGLWLAWRLDNHNLHSGRVDGTAAAGVGLVCHLRQRLDAGDASHIFLLVSAMVSRLWMCLAVTFSRSASHPAR